MVHGKKGGRTRGKNRFLTEMIRFSIIFSIGLKIAHLALKHRLGKNHKTRIITFIGSPIEADEKELIKVAKKLKKEKVSVDVVSFGEVDENAEILKKFVETINGRDGTGSHLVTIPPGPHLSDALISSAIIQVRTNYDKLTYTFKLIQYYGNYTVILFPFFNHKN